MACQPLLRDAACECQVQGQVPAPQKDGRSLLLERREPWDFPCFLGGVPTWKPTWKPTWFNRKSSFRIHWRSSMNLGMYYPQPWHLFLRKMKFEPDGIAFSHNFQVPDGFKHQWVWWLNSRQLLGKNHQCLNVRSCWNCSELPWCWRPQNDSLKVLPGSCKQLIVANFQGALPRFLVSSTPIQWQ